MTDLRARLTKALVEKGDYLGFSCNSGIRKTTAQEIVDILLSLPDIAVVDRSIIDGLIKSFRYVEEGGQRLYDASTHRWVDLLAEVTRND
jgi:hypothetical protein